MAEPSGTWDVVIATPMGKHDLTLQLAQHDGKLVGTATRRERVVSLENATWNGARLRWSQVIAGPVRLSFDIKIDGDVMTGVAKAGFLPAARLHGRRQQ